MSSRALQEEATFISQSTSAPGNRNTLSSRRDPPLKLAWRRPPEIHKKHVSSARMQAEPWYAGTETGATLTQFLSAAQASSPLPAEKTMPGLSSRLMCLSRLTCCMLRVMPGAFPT